MTPKQLIKTYPPFKVSEFDERLLGSWPYEFFVTEKLRGMRAIYRNGTFISRQGNVLAAITKWFPEIAFLDQLCKAVDAFYLDGELYYENSTQADINSAVKKFGPNTKKLIYYIFDYRKLNDDSTYQDRYQHLHARGHIVCATPINHATLVPLITCARHNLYVAYAYCKNVVQKGGEGLIFRNPLAVGYPDERTTSVLKLKPVIDCEAIVTGWKPGIGKYKNLIGSLECRCINGPAQGQVTFVSGMTDAERVEFTKNPPVDVTITIEFNELTKYGKPSNPRFVAIREGQD